jgi:hypothetical protein
MSGGLQRAKLCRLKLPSAACAAIGNSNMRGAAR